jgi:tetratricopeptide (TPR) repeat protein
VLIKQRPQDPALHNTLGALYGRSGNPAKALQEFQEALKLNPKFGPAYLNIGDNYLAQNDRPRALENYLRAGQLTPALDAAHRNAGDLYLVDKKIDEAIAAYRRALTANPNNVLALANLARIYTEERKDLKQALSLAKQAERLAPKDWYVKDVLGWVLYETGKTSEAVKRLEEARALDARAPRLRYHLGLAYLKQGKKNQAATELRTALELAPNMTHGDEVRKILGELGQ